jgi:hypothetical protein
MVATQTFAHQTHSHKVCSMNLFCGVVNESSSKPSTEQNFTAILQVISLHDPSLLGGLDRRSLRLPSSPWQASIHTAIGCRGALRRSVRPKAQRRQDLSDGRHNRTATWRNPELPTTHQPRPSLPRFSFHLNPLPRMGRMGTEGFAMAGFHKPLAVGLRYAVPVVR